MVAVDHGRGGRNEGRGGRRKSNVKCEFTWW